MVARSIQLGMKVLANGLLIRLEKTALAIARETCPVQSGDLLPSLYTERTQSSVTLGSPLDYAEGVENGRPEVNVSGTYVSKVRRHKRRTKRGKVTVRAHTKTFNNMKPVLISGDQSGEDTEGVGQSSRANQVWRTLSSSPGTEGTHFMQNALNKAGAETLSSRVVAEEIKQAFNAVGIRAR